MAAWVNLAALQWATEQDLVGKHRHLLFELAAMANGNGFAWPSVRSLGERLELHPRNVRKLLADLEREGFIMRQVEAGPGGVNIYALKCFTVIQGRAPAPSPPGRQRPTPPGASALPPRAPAPPGIKAGKRSIEEPPLAPRRRGDGKRPRPLKDKAAAWSAANAAGHGEEISRRYESGLETLGEILKDLGFLHPSTPDY